jgi:hypothetical protein
MTHFIYWKAEKFESLLSIETMLPIDFNYKNEGSYLFIYLLVNPSWQQSLKVSYFLFSMKSLKQYLIFVKIWSDESCRQTWTSI